MDVWDSVLGLAGRACVREDVAFRDGRPSSHAQRTEMRQRHLGVADGDCDREPARRNLARERDLARDRRPYRRRVAERDVDAAVLAGGVRVGTDGEATQHGAFGRP
jgi:hypothetical protein